MSQQYDQWGRPIPPAAYGYTQPAGPQGPSPNYYPGPAQQVGGAYNSPVRAVMNMPGMAELGGQDPNQPAWIRYPFYPTAPYMSTSPQVGFQTRFYGVTLRSTDTNYTVNQEASIQVPFDLPCRIIAFNGACADTGSLVTNTNGGLLNHGQDCFLFRAEYNGDKLHIAARLGSTVLGTMANPGELGGVGYTVDGGGTLIIGITPLSNAPATCRIDITIAVLEMRGPRNYTVG